MNLSSTLRMMIMVLHALRSVRPPLINRGYWARVQAIKQFYDKFLALEGPKQIVVLGCGFDTTYLRLLVLVSDLQRAGTVPTSYVELDYAEVVKRKIKLLKSVPALRAVLPLPDDGKRQLTAAETEAHLGPYHLLPANLENPELLTTRLIDSNLLQPDLPTLFLSECVIIYLRPELGSALIRWAAEHFK